MLLCISLFGCAQGNAESTTSSTSTSLSATIPATTHKIATEPSTEQASAHTTTAKPEKKTTAKKSTEKTTTKKITNTNKSTQSTITENTQPSSEPTTSELTCTVEIECTAILSNMDSLKEGHEEYVPADGILLNEYTLTLSSGASAYDALSTACTQNNISVNAQKTMYGTYVAGINNLDEKDCTKGGGWVYKVNGTYPPKSADKYRLSNGDKVVFSYTCS